MPPSSLAPESPTAAHADPLQVLRHATAAQHAELDANLAIAQPDASLADYASHAHALAAWLQVLWPHLEALQASTPGFVFTPAERLAALKADLQDVQTKAPSHSAATWPRPSAATEARVAQALSLAQGSAPSNAALWGLAYVVEGSQLGGQVLYRQLAPRLAPHPLRYLHGDGAATGARWKLFISLLRQHVVSPSDIDFACQGAVAAFSGLQSHFQDREGTPQ